MLVRNVLYFTAYSTFSPWIPDRWWEDVPAAAQSISLPPMMTFTTWGWAENDLHLPLIRSNPDSLYLSACLGKRAAEATTLIQVVDSAYRIRLFVIPCLLYPHSVHVPSRQRGAHCNPICGPSLPTLLSTAPRLAYLPSRLWLYRNTRITSCFLGPPTSSFDVSQNLNTSR
jgi:hypothetical protein